MAHLADPIADHSSAPNAEQINSEYLYVEEAARHLRALSNPARLFLLCALAEGEKCVGELEKASGMRQAYVSQQLARLRQEGMVMATRNGRTVSYALADRRVAPILDVLSRQFSAQPHQPQ